MNISSQPGTKRFHLVGRHFQMSSLWERGTRGYGITSPVHPENRLRRPSDLRGSTLLPHVDPSVHGNDIKLTTKIIIPRDKTTGLPGS